VSGPVQLPEIPDSWLRKIKEVTNPGLVSAVLGSSLLASFIAMGSAVLASYLTNRGNEKLEKVKLQLQADSDQVKKRIQAYNTLARDLNSLASALDAYLRMSEIAGRAQSDILSAFDLQAQHDKVGLAEKEVLAAQRDIVPYDSGLPGEINACLEKLSLALAATEKNPKVAASLRPVLEQLNELVSRVNGEMNKSLARSPIGVNLFVQPFAVTGVQ
jgi:hypothetical protein